VNNSKALDVRIFQTGCSSCGGGIGSSVRSCQEKEIEREREREREREKDQFFEKESDLRKREVCDWKEGRKEGNEVREGREVRWTWMDGSGWMDMGEHFRGTGGR